MELKSSPWSFLMKKHLLKILITMKFTILFLMLTASQIFGSAFSQTVKLNLDLKNASVTDVFAAIENQSKFKFLYHDALLEGEKSRNVQVKDQTIEEILDLLFIESNNTFSVLDNNLVVITPKASEIKQVGTITGTITDNSGLPLPGVNIVIKGTSQGTVTDLDGNFEIDVPSNESILAFSFIGYLPEEITVGDQKIIDVVLIPDLMALDEVVVVGYGTIKKINLTGAVDNVSGSVLTKRPATNSGNLLQGRLTGVDVIQPTAEPGKENPIIQIRGKGSYGAESDTKNNPLILIDGVSGSLNNLSPNDIESVSVLKDAASASIYGARAANGVILVTTKKGKKGEPIITYSGNISIQSPTRLPKVISNSAEYMEMYNRAAYRQNLPFKYAEEEIENYRNPPDSLKDYYPNFNAYDYWYGNAIVHNHNISVAGGGENSMYNASFSYLNQNAMLPGYRFKRYNALINYTLDINKWLTLGTIVNITNKYDKKPPMHDVFLPLYITTANPLNEAYLPDGSGRVVSQAYRGEPRSRNPAEVYLMGNYYSKENNLNSQAYIDFKPFKGLIWTTKFAIDYTDRFFKTHQQAYTTNYLHYMSRGDHVTSDGEIDKPGVTDDYLKENTPTLFSVVNYEIKFGENHDFAALAGYEQISFKRQALRVNRPTSAFPRLSELQAYSSGNQSLFPDDEGKRLPKYNDPEEWAMQSLFGRINYGYKNKYLLEANIRYDGTSKVSPDYRWGVFPSVSAGWVVSEEGFVKNNIDWLSIVKLRASYGVLGNQNIGTYLYQNNINIDGVYYSFDERSLTQGGYIKEFKDQSLRWESTRITDLGLDMNIKNGLFGVVFDWYDKYTYDILAEQPVPKSMGFEDDPRGNDGKMRNWGVEVEVMHRYHIGQLFYDAFFQFASYKNELVHIGATEIKSGTIREIGQPYGSYYMYTWDGIFQIADSISGDYPVHLSNPNPRPGDLKMKDIDGNDTINDLDRQVIGGAYPDFTYSFGFNLNYKNWNLSVFFQGVQGRKVWVNYWSPTHHLFNVGTSPTEKWRDAWTPENPTNELPAIFVSGWRGVSTYNNSTFFLMDASYLRLKNVMLSYSFPDILIDRIRLKELTVFVSGENLLTFTKYEGSDPERHLDHQSVVYSHFPQARIINFGLNVKF